MTDLITELKHDIDRLTEWWNWSGPRPDVPVTSVGNLVNHLPTILAKLEEGERMREAATRLVTELDDDMEHGKHAHEQECPICCAIEDTRRALAGSAT